MRILKTGLLVTTNGKYELVEVTPETFDTCKVDSWGVLRWWQDDETGEKSGLEGVVRGCEK